MTDRTSENHLDLDPPSQKLPDRSQNLPHLREITKKFAFKNETIFTLVDHSVGAIALDCGYHIAHQSSLDVLNDVCCDYLKKIATLLRTTSDTEDWRDSESDFVDSLERVFHQLNIPSAANLHQFICKTQAIKRHQYRQSQQPPMTPNNSANSSTIT